MHGIQKEQRLRIYASMDISVFFICFLVLLTSFFCFIFPYSQHRLSTLLAGFEATHRNSSGNTQVPTRIQN